MTFPDQRTEMIEIAMLHHVKRTRRTDIGPLSDYAVTPSELESYLLDRQEWTPVSTLTEVGQNDGTCLLPTFDDGYRNNVTEALPVLEKHEIPCLLFITTGFIDGTAYPYELELAEILEQADTLSLPDRSEPVELHDMSERRALYRELRLPLKPVPPSERDVFMDQVARLNDYDRAEMQKEPMLDWDDVRTLSEHPLVTIGAHTKSHVLLSHQSWRTAWEEIRSSKEQLEQQIRQPVRHFSYPYGGNDVVVRQMVRWAGFRYGFTTQANRAEHVTMWNRFSLPRIDIGELLPDHA